jgi:antitoxin Phd
MIMLKSGLPLRLKNANRSNISIGGVIMYIDIENFVSISEANKNFSRIARLVDENGSIIILKNNSPRYVLLEYNMFLQDSALESESESENADDGDSSVLDELENPEE